MKVVVQRVSRAEVTIDGTTTGKIGKGLVLLIGIHPEDDSQVLQWMCDKILRMRIFNDEKGKMNLSVQDVQGELLLVSQFTLYGNVQKGTRPGFTGAAPPEIAEPLYDDMIQYMKRVSGLSVETGVFGAMMDVELVNEGPVTLIVEK